LALSSLLDVRNLSKTFQGLRAVDDVSFEVRPGEIVGLIGPNGAGKSTVINLLSGFHRPSHGQIMFKGEQISNAEPSAIARLGMVRTFQHIRLFRSLTVRDNVEAAAQAKRRLSLADALLRTAHHRHAMAAMRAEADELLDLFQLGPIQHQLASTLAYGEQRRLEIVRALAAEPTLLLLDEPAAGMNDTEAATLADFLGEIHARHGLAILLVEHHLDVVMRLCQRIVVLDHGTAIASGTPDEITHHPEVLRAYLGEAA
jgi:ABC-type branched-subunit amino acid transport system ATPase component